MKDRGRISGWALLTALLFAAAVTAAGACATGTGPGNIAPPDTTTRDTTIHTGLVLPSPGTVRGLLG